MPPTSSPKSELNATSSSSADDFAPLPGRQFRWFILFFHWVFVVGLVVSLFVHWQRKGPVGSFFALAIMATVQVVLYVWAFAVPSLTNRWGSRAWWWAYYVTSLLLVLAECRIEPAFDWFILAYIGQICALPIRVSLPVSLAIVAAFFLNKLGWSRLMAMTPLEWFFGMFSVAAWLALLLFMGRAIITSSHRAKLIQDLETAKRELELARHRDAELAVLKERERLARDLHDSLGHSLVTVTVQLEAVQRLLATDPARAAALIADTQKLTRNGMEDLRRSLANLRAPGLGDRPLVQTLRTFCGEIAKRSGLDIECQLADAADRLPPAVAEMLWRVAQEGLTNVEKHAQAHAVRLSLALQPREILLRVGDDGVGLGPEAEETPGHYGLRGMRERVEGLGGTFTLAPAGNKGTLIEVRIPVIGS
jgi:signal transduction histidine kinase